MRAAQVDAQKFARNRRKHGNLHSPSPSVKDQRLSDRYLGRHIGKYRVIRFIGGGAFAWVYECIDRDLEIPVALKILRPEFSGDPIAEARFRREASTAARLRHRNIVVVRDVGQSDGASFVAMDLLAGSLGDRLRENGVLPEQDVVRIGLDVAAALSAAHAAGIIHRDIKPDNLLSGPSGETVVADFGLARALAQHASLSATNQVMGTPHYFSPEQARGLELDGRSDLYSLGVTLFRAASGRLPFDGDDWYSVGRQHIDAVVPSPRTFMPTLSVGFERVILRLLAKLPADRYPDADALSAALVELLPLDHRQAIALGASRVTVGPFLPRVMGTPSAPADATAQLAALEQPKVVAAPSRRAITVAAVAAIVIVVAVGALRLTVPERLPALLGGSNPSRFENGVSVDQRTLASTRASERDSIASDSARRDVIQDSLFGLALDSASAAATGGPPNLRRAPDSVSAARPAQLSPSLRGQPGAPPSPSEASDREMAVRAVGTRVRLTLTTSDRATLFVDGRPVGLGSWTGEQSTGTPVTLRAELADAAPACESAHRDSTVRLKPGARTITLPVRGCAVLKIDVDASQRDAQLLFSPVDGGSPLRIRADSATGALLTRGRYALAASLARCYEYRDTVTASGRSTDTVFVRFRMDCKASAP